MAGIARSTGLASRGGGGAAALPLASREKDVVAALKLAGIHTVTADGLACIRRQIAREEDQPGALAVLAAAVRDRLAARGGGSGLSVDAALVTDVVAEATRGEEDTRADALEVVSALDTPRYAYDAARKLYHWCVRAADARAAAAAPACHWRWHAWCPQARKAPAGTHG